MGGAGRQLDQKGAGGQQWQTAGLGRQSLSIGREGSHAYTHTHTNTHTFSFNVLESMLMLGNYQEKQNIFFFFLNKDATE